VTLDEQYRAATERAAMFDVSDRALIEVTGRDRATFLHSFCTNDIKKLQPGEGCEAFVTNVKGRILGHILVFAEQDSLWIDSDPGTQTALLQHLDRYVITEDVQFRDRTNDFEKLFLCGPSTSAVILDAYILVFEETAMYARLSPSINIDSAIRRVPFTVEPGCLILASKNSTESLRSRLQACDVTPASSDVFNALRIEAMWPRYGVDATEEHLAQEAGRTQQAISFTKGCYLGQEPIARLDALGHTNRELRGIRCDAPGAFSPGTVVLDVAGASEVGRVSSVAVQPVTNCPVALAMIKTVANAPGTAVRIRTDDDGAEIGGFVFGPPPMA
jgi:folate-binding protein YgfZ